MYYWLFLLATSLKTRLIPLDLKNCRLTLEHKRLMKEIMNYMNYE